MSTFLHHLNDMKYLFQERGLQHVHSWLKQFASATTQGVTPTGAGAIGNLEVDAAGANGFTAALQTTVNPSGQQNLAGSAAGKIEFDGTAVPRTQQGWQSR